MRVSSPLQETCREWAYWDSSVILFCWNEISLGSESIFEFPWLRCSGYLRFFGVWLSSVIFPVLDFSRVFGRD